MRVTVRVDAGPLIGGGHAMRCLTLADALVERGGEVTFVAAAMPDAIAGRIVASGHKLVRIPASPAFDREGEHWHEKPLSRDAQDADVRATGAAVGATDWLIVDHYLLDAGWHSGARSFADRLLVIDDLANRQYDCDVLLDQTFGRFASAYDGRAPGAALLIGANHALLRPEFVRERTAAAARRRQGGELKRILVSIGTTDPGGITARIGRQVLAAVPNCAVDVVIGPQAAIPHELRRESGVSLHTSSNRMAELMRDADVAIGAGGMSALERCCLGLPSIILCLAENQRDNALALEKSGAAVIAAGVDDIGRQLNQLQSALVRMEMSEAAFSVTDGSGAQRVVAECLSTNRALRQAG